MEQDRRILTIIGHTMKRPRKVIRFKVYKRMSKNFDKLYQQIQEMLPIQASYVEKFITSNGKVIENFEEFFKCEELIFAVYNNLKLKPDDRKLSNDEQHNINIHNRPLYGLTIIKEKNSKEIIQPVNAMSTNVKKTMAPEAPIEEIVTNIMQPADPKVLKFTEHGMEYQKLPDLITKEYMIDRVLGFGDFRYIIKIINRNQEKQYALKVFDKEQIDGMIYKTEAKIIAKARHPNVVRILGIRENPKFYCLFLHCMQGNILMYMNKLGALDEKKASFVMHRLVTALHHLHSIKIVHGNIKPKNVLIRIDSKTYAITHVKLTDFSASFIYGETTQQTKGTKIFMAPEVLNGGECSPKSDVWSAGITMYILLLGSVSHTEINQNINDIYKKIRESNSVFTQITLPNQSRPCILILNGMLAKDPKNRFSCFRVLLNPWIQCHK